MVLIHRVCAWALVLLGVAHMGFTALAFKSWSPGAAWFLGTGLGFVVLGFLNLVAGAGAPKRAVCLCLIANLLGAAYTIALAAILAEPQAFVAVLVLLLLLGTTVRRAITSSSGQR
jgi:hypothetical protein